jgi:hypothetical protein
MMSGQSVPKMRTDLQSRHGVIKPVARHCDDMRLAKISTRSQCLSLVPILFNYLNESFRFWDG